MEVVLKIDVKKNGSWSLLAVRFMLIAILQTILHLLTIQ